MTGQAGGAVRIGIADLCDDALSHYMRALRRHIEDGVNVRMNTVLLARARQEQLARFRLRMRYGAVDDHRGTISYDAWHRLRAAPGYRLAAMVDRAQWRLGCGRYVLEWDGHDHPTALPRARRGRHDGRTP